MRSEVYHPNSKHEVVEYGFEWMREHLKDHTADSIHINHVDFATRWVSLNVRFDDGTTVFGYCFLKEANSFIINNPNMHTANIIFYLSVTWVRGDDWLDRIKLLHEKYD